MNPSASQEYLRISLWLFKCFANFFHPLSIRTQVGIADPGYRAKVDDICLPVDHKLNIISKAKNQTGRLSVKVTLRFRDDLHPWDDGENCFEFPHGIFWGPSNTIASIVCWLSELWVETQFGEFGQGARRPLFAPMFFGFVANALRTARAMTGESTTRAATR